MNDVAAQLGATVAAWMDAQGISKTDLSKRSGISRETVYRLLRGGNVDLHTIARIAEVFGISLARLIAGELPRSLVRDAGLSSRQYASQADMERLRRDIEALRVDFEKVRAGLATAAATQAEAAQADQELRANQQARAKPKQSGSKGRIAR